MKYAFKGEVPVGDEQLTPANSDETIFILTKADVLLCAGEMGIPDEAITDDVLDQVKKGVMWGLECWSEVMKAAINTALKG